MLTCEKLPFSSDYFKKLHVVTREDSKFDIVLRTWVRHWTQHIQSDRLSVLAPLLIPASCTSAPSASAVLECTEPLPTVPASRMGNFQIPGPTLIQVLVNAPEKGVEDGPSARDPAHHGETQWSSSSSTALACPSLAMLAIWKVNQQWEAPPSLLLPPPPPPSSSLTQPF